MSYELKILENPDYLQMELSGLLDKDVSVEMVDSIAATLIEKGQYKLLLDITALSLNMSLIEDYDQASYAAKVFAGSKHMIACLSENTAFNSNQFFETVGVNRGLRYQAFTEKEDAIDWLMKD